MSNQKWNWNMLHTILVIYLWRQQAHLAEVSHNLSAKQNIKSTKHRAFLGYLLNHAMKLCKELLQGQRHIDIPFQVVESFFKVLCPSSSLRVIKLVPTSWQCTGIFIIFRDFHLRREMQAVAFAVTKENPFLPWRFRNAKHVPIRNELSGSWSTS